MHWYSTLITALGPGKPRPEAAPRYAPGTSDNARGSHRALTSRRPPGARKKVPPSTSAWNTRACAFDVLSYHKALERAMLDLTPFGRRKRRGDASVWDLRRHQSSIPLSLGSTDRTTIAGTIRVTVKYVAQAMRHALAHPSH